MRKKIKVIGELSRKAKINIFVAIFLVFIVITIFFSVNQIISIIEKREKLVELEEKLSWVRNNNIEILALEKSLYNDDTIEMEARKQFNMAYGSETNLFVVIEDEEEINQINLNGSNGLKKDVYSNTNLWENIKIFYNKEINNN